MKQETNPRLMQLGASREPILALRFTVEFGAQTGRIDWLLPEALLAPIREALASDDGRQPSAQARGMGADAGRGAAGRAKSKRAPFSPRPKISLGELVRLTPGDIIPIDAPQHAIAARGRRPAVSRPIRRFARAQRTEDHSRRFRDERSRSQGRGGCARAIQRSGPRRRRGRQQEINLNLILDVAVTLALEVGRARMSVRELLQLAPGAIVELDRLAGEPLDVLVNGVRIARGEVVVVNEKFGIRLTDVVSATERMEQAMTGMAQPASPLSVEQHRAAHPEPARDRRADLGARLGAEALQARRLRGRGDDRRARRTGARAPRTHRAGRRRRCAGAARRRRRRSGGLDVRSPRRSRCRAQRRRRRSPTGCASS